MDIQDIIVFMIVLLAAAWLARRIYRTLNPTPGAHQIGACDQCPNNRDTAKAAQIVEIKQKASDESL